MKIFVPNHVAIYIGKGKRLIIHAAGLKVHESKLKVYRNKRHRIRIYRKSTLTVGQLQKIKKYAYGRIGVKYDWRGIASFVLPFIKESPNSDICIELDRDAYLKARIRIIPKDRPQLCSPEAFEEYVKALRFKVCYEWDKGKETGELKDIPAGAIIFTEGFGIFAHLIKFFGKKHKVDFTDPLSFE